MSLEEIRKTIEKEARAEADRVTEEGDREADSAVAEAKQKALEILKAAKAEAQKEADRIKREMLSGAEMEANGIILAAKESVLEHGVGPVMRASVRELSGKKSDKLIESAVKSFGKLAPKGEIVVKTGKKNIQAVRNLGFLAVEGSRDELTLSTKDGRISLDASAKSIVEQHEKEARSILAARLFGKEGK